MYAAGSARRSGCRAPKVFGRHFAEDQQHQCQCGRAKCYPEIAAAQAQGDEAHQHGRGHVDDGAQQ